MIKVNWSSLKELNGPNVRGIPGTPGLYRLSYKSENDGNFYVFYVGKSQNLQERVFLHMQDTEPNLCIRKAALRYKCYFKFAQMEYSEDIHGAEAFLIDYFKPSCNMLILKITRKEVNVD